MTTAQGGRDLVLVFKDRVAFFVSADLQMHVFLMHPASGSPRHGMPAESLILASAEMPWDM
jgi:hypothetical protein